MISQPYVIHFRAMGCACNVWLDTQADGEAILQRVPTQVEAIEACLSRFRPDSELSFLNVRAGQWMQVSPILLQAALVSKHAARMTDGLCNPLILPALRAAGYDRSFDQLGDAHIATQPAPCVPDWMLLAVDLRNGRVCVPRGAGLDVGGVAKGWASERIAEQLSVHGPCLVDLGGDMTARGKEWTIELAEPGSETDTVLSVTLRNAAIATSGTDHRRWKIDGGINHHLIDPRTGVPAVSDVVSATVIHSSAYAAEAYAKAVLLLGSSAGLEWVGRQWNTAALVVLEDGSVLSTPRFMAYVKETNS
jgi:FAD:protein FMN transferase